MNLKSNFAKRDLRTMGLPAGDTCYRKIRTSGFWRCYMVKRCAVLAMLCCTLLALAAQRSDIPREGLSGVITDPNGAILPEATIQVQHWKFASYGQHPQAACDSVTHSDQNGRFSVSLPPGSYDVFVSYPTMSPVAKKIQIAVGKYTLFNVELKFDPLTKFIE